MKIHFKTILNFNILSVVPAKINENPKYVLLVEQHDLKNVNDCWNTNISLYLETSGGQNFYLYFIIGHFSNGSVN
jgi:hypothetical protein